MRLNEPVQMPARTILAALLAFAGVAVSCVNEDYDLSKPIDKTVEIKGDISLPIGSSEEIKIGKFLNFENGADGFGCDDDGNYFISFKAEEGFKAEFEVPAIKLSLSEALTIIPVSISTGSFAGRPVPPSTPVQILDPYPFNRPSTIKIDKPFTEEMIEDIKSMTTDALATINFTILTGKAIIKSGTEIKFPSFITIEKQTSETSWKTEGSSIIITEDINLTPANTVGFNVKMTALDFTLLPEGMGLVGSGSDRKFHIEDDILVNGSVQIVIDPSDFSTIPDELALHIQTIIPEIDIKSVRAKVNISQNIPAQSVEIGEDLPDFLKGDNITLDIWNPVLVLKTENDSPITADVSAVFKGYPAGSDTPYASAALGQTEQDRIRLQAGTTTDYFISRKGEHPKDKETAGTTCKDITFDGISQLFSTIPGKIGIEDIKVKSPEEGYIEITTGEEHSCNFDYEFYCLLAFGKDLRIKYTLEDIKGLNSTFNSDLQIDVNTLSLEFNMVSTIPLSMNLTAKAVDTEGNAINGVNVNVNGSIKAGKIGAEATSPVKIILSTTEPGGLKNFDGIRLTLTGESNESVEGTALNKAQSIRLTDIKARLDGGFTTNL